MTDSQYLTEKAREWCLEEKVLEIIGDTIMVSPAFNELCKTNTKKYCDILIGIIHTVDSYCQEKSEVQRALITSYLMEVMLRKDLLEVVRRGYKPEQLSEEAMMDMRRKIEEDERLR